MRHIGLVVASLALVSASAAFGAAASWPALDRARGALEANSRLGDSLAGRPAAPEQAAEAARLASEGEADARAALAQQPEQAAPHYVLGMLLCLAYRPAVDIGLLDREPIALERGGPGREEGLAKLEAAVRMAPGEPEYSLGYGKALLIYGRAEEAVDRLRELWRNRSALPREQGARTAHLLGEGILALGNTAEAEEWLDTALALDPADGSAARKLRQLSREDPSAIHWRTYSAGLALARLSDEPTLIWFYGCECAACEKLGKEVLTDPQVVAKSKRFVCIKVDHDARRDLASQHDVRMCPTTIFLDSAGREHYRFVGYRSVSEYLSEIKSYLATEAGAGTTGRSAPEGPR